MVVTSQRGPGSSNCQVRKNHLMLPTCTRTIDVYFDPSRKSRNWLCTTKLVFPSVYVQAEISGSGWFAVFDSPSMPTQRARRLNDPKAPQICRPGAFLRRAGRLAVHVQRQLPSLRSSVDDPRSQVLPPFVLLVMWPWVITYASISGAGRGFPDGL